MNNIQNLPVPVTWPGRLVYAFVTIVLPIICFTLTFDDSISPDWQSGQLSDYAMIMLGGTVAQLFYPFILYALICMALLLISPHRFSQVFIVRLGIYTGAILSLQYSIIAGVSLFIHKPWFSLGILNIVVFGLVACAIPVGLSRLFIWSIQKIRVRRSWVIISGVTVCVWVILLLFFTSGDIIFIPIYWLVIFSLASAPFWCLAIALFTSKRLLQYERLEKRGWVLPGSAISVWVIAYISVWRIAILQTIELYNSLPTTPPDCYIATAAARGHRQVVKSQLVRASNGDLIWVNSQMQYLKSAELALMVIFPMLHGFLRRIYNTLGPLLVHTLIHPVLADLVYLLLKPLEWGAKGVMRLLISPRHTVIKQIYYR